MDGILGALAGDRLRIVGEAAFGDGRRIDHGDDAVDGEARADGRPVEGLDQGLRQSEPRGLDENVLGRQVAVDQRLHGRDEIVGHGAAQAAIGELDDILLGAALDAAAPQDFAIDADAAELIDDDGEALAARGLEQMADERGFSRAEEAGDDGRGDAGSVGHSAASLAGSKGAGKRAITLVCNEAGRPDGKHHAGLRLGVGCGIGEKIGGMLGPDLADKVRPFSSRREAHAAAALAIGEAERGNDLRRRVLAHAVGERLQRLIEAAAVGLLAFGHGLCAAAPAGHADIKMWAGVQAARSSRQTLSSHPRVQAPSGGHRGKARAWPIEPATEAARAPRPASRIKQATAGLLARGSFACRRLPRGHPSGQLRQAFRLQLRGQLRNSGENPSPHSLFTPHLRGDRQFSLTKGRGRRTCQRRRLSGGSGLRRRNSSL